MNPQMPVLLTPIVTSPSFRPSPFLIDSRLGSDSATQSSWAGLVKTPMLGLLRVVVVDMASRSRRTRMLGAWVNSTKGGFGRSLLTLERRDKRGRHEKGKETAFLNNKLGAA